MYVCTVGPRAPEHTAGRLLQALISDMRHDVAEFGHNFLVVANVATCTHAHITQAACGASACMHALVCSWCRARAVRSTSMPARAEPGPSFLFRWRRCCTHAAFYCASSNTAHTQPSVSLPPILHACFCSAECQRFTWLQLKATRTSPNSCCSLVPRCVSPNLTVHVGTLMHILCSKLSGQGHRCPYDATRGGGHAGLCLSL